MNRAAMKTIWECLLRVIILTWSPYNHTWYICTCMHICTFTILHQQKGTSLWSDHHWFGSLVVADATITSLYYYSYLILLMHIISDVSKSLYAPCHKFYYFHPKTYYFILLLPFRDHSTVISSTKATCTQRLPQESVTGYTYRVIFGVTEVLTERKQGKSFFFRFTLYECLLPIFPFSLCINLARERREAPWLMVTNDEGLEIKWSEWRVRCAV